MGLNFHEDLRRSAHTRSSSDRNFGLVFAAGFALLGVWPLLKRGPVRWPLLAVAAVFLLVALIRPGLLRPLNKVWTLFGLLLGRIMNPIITAILFFLVFTPAGIIGRLLGKDPLRLKHAPEASTYWIIRNPPGPAPETMAKQF
ncbi:MAG TPA: SxtJ family membrane protein [Bryobacteraceae bacterium]|nr:SxtJ family membrane protein [Bryobacteraceae bacterium]